LSLPGDTEVAVVEMGMRGAGQIAELCRLAPPRVGCVTAVGPVHLELLGTVEGVAAAKAELLAALGPGGTAVVPAGEPLLEPFLAGLDPGVRVERFGDDLDLDLRLPPLTAWQRRNAAAALACCRALGRPPAAGAEVALELSPLRGSTRPLPGGGVLVEDCYNANPPSMAAALRDLVARPGRRVAVLADMMELGADEERFHVEVGADAAALGVDVLVAVGERGRWYADGAAGAGGTEVIRFETVPEAVAGVPGVVRPGDAVLLKGSRAMALERVGAALAPPDG
jgi:UDP-N-acetylmuramyl pentapeptide synthase